MNLQRIALILSFFVCCIAYAQDFPFVNELQQRRDHLQKHLENPAIAFIFSTPIRNKNSDIDYEYRPSSNIYYTTGIAQPETILVLLSSATEQRQLLFVQKKSLEEEIWTGRRLSQQQASEHSGIREVYTTERFPEFVDALYKPQKNSFAIADEIIQAMAKKQIHIYLELSAGVWQSSKFSHAWQLDSLLRRLRLYPRIRDLKFALSSLRLTKSKREIQFLRRAIATTSIGLRRAFAMAKPGVYEYQVEAEIEYCYKNDNMDWAFPSIVASGPNAAILHYMDSQSQMQEGDLLLMDVGAACQFYSADITRTIPISGKFTPQQKAIYNLVLAAQQKGLEQVRTGATLYDIHEAAVATISEGLLQLGLITDMKSSQYRLYFMHGTCHWLGLDTHDVGGNARLAPGMVFTIEPGIYVGENVLLQAQELYGDPFAQTIAAKVKEYMNVCVRIEDDILLTDDGPVVLSADLPKGADEIEELLRKLRSGEETP